MGFAVFVEVADGFISQILGFFLNSGGLLVGFLQYTVAAAV